MCNGGVKKNILPTSLQPCNDQSSYKNNKIHKYYFNNWISYTPLTKKKKVKLKPICTIQEINLQETQKKPKKIKAESHETVGHQ